jgi:glycosyltransferase involved in cell wall biosynthesis
MKKILIVPDSIWGPDSGHRSTQFLVKILLEKGNHVAVYAENNKKYIQQKEEYIENNSIVFFPKKPYRFKQQFSFFNREANNEFHDVINTFKPDVVFYFGTIRNKISIDVLLSSSMNIPYYYLPLTNEFWCLKNFAGLKDGQCYKCINSNYLHAIQNSCLDGQSVLSYMKEIIERFLSRKRIMNAHLLLGYSNSQIETFTKYGFPEEKTKTTKVFFDHNTIKGIQPKKGDYFLVLGQMTIAKGWHFIPELMKLNQAKGIKYKFIIYNKNTANEFIKINNLQGFIDNNQLEVLSNLETHNSVLEVMAKSLAVIVPSNYPTTGEFTVLEAMGLKKPVIAFNVGAHRNFLSDKKNALISNSGDVVKMSSDIASLSSDDQLWKRLSHNCFQSFNQITDFNMTQDII